MSDLLNDQNEFDHVVKHKTFRYQFLEEFGKGWNLAHSPNLNSSQMQDKLKVLLKIIEHELSAIEQDEEEMKRFALFLGFLIGMLRIPVHRVTSGNTKIIIEIIFKLRKGYWDYYLVLRKLILEWFERNKEEIMKNADQNMLKSANSIISVLN
jgi:hypothetical protein